MEFLKKHYEKILLSVVLLGLGGAALWLPGAIDEAKQQLEVQIEQKVQNHPVTDLDLSQPKAALERLKNPAPVVLSGEHNLFNPVTWKYRRDGSIFKILVEGPEALVVSNIHALYTSISYDRPSGSGYYFGLQVHSAKKGEVYIKVGDSNKKAIPFKLTGIQGAPEAPDSFDIELTDTQENVKVSKAQPFQRVDGYSVDLIYPPDNQTMNNKHVNEYITFGGEGYKIIYITNN